MCQKQYWNNKLQTHHMAQMIIGGGSTWKLVIDWQPSTWLDFCSMCCDTINQSFNWGSVVFYFILYYALPGMRYCLIHHFICTSFQYCLTSVTHLYDIIFQDFFQILRVSISCLHNFAVFKHNFGHSNFLHIK